MKYAYINPTVVAVDEIPDQTFQSIKGLVDQAHQHPEYNDEGNPGISVRGGQQIQLLPNQFNLNIDVLKDYVEQQCQEYLDKITAVTGRSELLPVKPMLVSAWTIRQSSGDYQALHSHEAHISGNIYIEIPDADPLAKNSDGCLEFRFPVVKTPSRFILTDSWMFTPQLAKMVVFPSYLAHTVYPWRSSGNRTVLAWDVKLVDK